MRPSIIGLSASLGLVAVVAVGARLGTIVTPYILIGAVCAVGILVARGHIKPRDYPVYIFGMSLGLLWQSSLMGAHVVGADIHTEYYISDLVMRSGWDWSYPHQYNTSVVVAVLAPAFSKIFHLDLVWVYKAVFPVFLACVPLIMYFVFRKQFGEKKAFWAALFFMAVPVMSAELVGMAKSMVAEVLFALAILVMVSGMRQLYKGIALPVLVILALLCHYTVGLVLLGFLVACLGMMAVGRLVRLRGRRVSLIVLALAILLSSSAGYLYFSRINDGEIISTMGNMVRGATVDVRSNIDNLSVVPRVVDPQADMPPQQSTSFYVKQQPALVRVGVGLDFPEASAWGKAFRIVQYLTQLLVVLGLVQLWRRRKEYSFAPEYVACMVAGFALLGFCVFIPLFSALVNMSRFYHLSLFFLAPLFVLGCEMVFRKGWVIPVVLLVYFMFTSGLVFEATKSDVLERMDTPYSLPMSSERLGVTGVHDADDLDCAGWLANGSNAELPIVSDLNAKRLMEGYLGRSPRLYGYDVDHYVPWTPWETPGTGGYYIFLTTWNAEHGKMVLYSGVSNSIGARNLRATPVEVYDLPIVWQSGKAQVRLRE